MNQKDLRKWENKDNFIYRDDIHFIIKGKYTEWDGNDDFLLIDIIRRTTSNTGKIKEDFIADMKFNIINRNIEELNVSKHTFIDYNNPDRFRLEVPTNVYNHSKFINAIGASLILNYIDLGRIFNYIVNCIYDQYNDLVDSLEGFPIILDDQYVEFFIDEDKMNKIIYYNGETEKELSLNI